MHPQTLLDHRSDDGVWAGWSVPWHRWLWALDSLTPPQSLLQSMLDTLWPHIPTSARAFPGQRLSTTCHDLRQWAFDPIPARRTAVLNHIPFLARHAAPLASTLYWASRAVQAYPPLYSQAFAPTTALWSASQSGGLSAWSYAVRRALTELVTTMGKELHRQPGTTWAMANRRSAAQLQDALLVEREHWQIRTGAAAASGRCDS